MFSSQHLYVNLVSYDNMQNKSFLTTNEQVCDKEGSKGCCLFQKYATQRFWVFIN